MVDNSFNDDSISSADTSHGRSFVLCPSKSKTNVPEANVSIDEFPIADKVIACTSEIPVISLANTVLLPKGPSSLPELKSSDVSHSTL